MIEIDGSTFQGMVERVVELKSQNEQLLAALKRMVSTWDAYLDSPRSYPAYAEARAAIEKVEGKA